MKGLLRKADAFQRGHTWLGFPLAVVKKFSEDRAGQLAALVAYYGFFSLFPLLLVLVTVLGFVVAEDAALRERILDSALKQFPVIGDQIKENVHAIEGSGVALAVGFGGALWAGLAGVKAAENAMDQVWDVRVKDQPSTLKAILRAAIMLATLGMFVLVAGFLGGVAAGTETGSTALQAAGIAATLGLNFVVFWIGFRVLTVADVSWRDVLPGAIIASILWSALQAAGGYIIGHRLESASEVYGVFAIVIGLLSWLYLGGQVTLLAAELNVVRAKRLWPRALDPDDLTEADRRALRELAEVEERRDEQNVEVSFDAPDDGGADPRVRDRRPGGADPQEHREEQRGKQVVAFGGGAILGALLASRGRRRPIDRKGKAPGPVRLILKPKRRSD